jgi:ATP-dependent RNA helicase RhlE
MLNLGFRTQLTAILAMMPKNVKTFYSATMTDEVDAILNDYFDYPQEALQPLGLHWKTSNKSLTMQLISILVNLLKHLLQENEDMSRVLIFVNNKKISDMLHGRIDEDFEVNLE